MKNFKLNTIYIINLNKEKYPVKKTYTGYISKTGIFDAQGYFYLQLYENKVVFELKETENSQLLSTIVVNDNETLLNEILVLLEGLFKTLQFTNDLYINTIDVLKNTSEQFQKSLDKYIVFGIVIAVVVLAFMVFQAMKTTGGK